MVAAPPPILSDHAPDLARRAGLGDRFHYFRGRSGRRYLFSKVDRDALADFRSAVVILAKRAAGGRLAVRAMTTLDPCGRPSNGRPTNGRRPWPPTLPADGVILVHLLAMTEADRGNLLDDLIQESLPLAA